MAKSGYNPGAAEDPETNPDYQHEPEVAEEPDKESTSAEVG